MKSIRHRRGTLDEWRDINPVIPDGEIALVKRDTGYGIVVGDGKSEFSSLAPLGSNISKNYNDSIIEVCVQSGDDLRYDLLEELYIDISTPVPEDFFATFTFISGEYATMLSLPENVYIYFTGNDCTEGEFYPTEFMRYNVFLFYDGALQGVVRGYYYE